MSSFIISARTLRRSRILSLFGAAFELIVRKRERQRNITALSSLSDHQLRDIGISRSDIPHAIDRGRFGF